MRPDLFLRMLAEETGETLFALDMDRIGHAAKQAAADAPASIAMVPLQGILTPKGVNWGGRQLTPGMNTFRAQLAEATGRKDVGAIIIPVDSPGGTVAASQETAEAVADAAKIKPVVAMVDTLAASAAYWIASQAGKMWMTPSAEVGSIGIMANHMEYSDMLAKEGIKATIIRSKSAKYKNEANPLEPLSEEALANLQAEADSHEDVFVATIAKGRGATADHVRASYGQGRTLATAAALTAGMADKSGSMADLIASLHTQGGTVRRRFSSWAFD